MLRYKADIRSIAFVVTYLVLVSVALAVPMPWWATGILVVVLSLLSFFCAVITHNTVHVPVFRNKTLNRVFQVMLTVSYGHPVSMFVPGHNLSHHQHTQTPRDLMRTNKMQYRWNLLNQLLFMFVVGPAIFRDNLVYAKAMKTQKPAWYRQLMIEGGFYVAFLVGTLAYALFAHGLVHGLITFLLFVVVPHQYAAWGIMGINFVQHDGCDPEHPYNHSRNFTGKLVNWFTFNNGYHGYHHYKPGAHWSRLPELHHAEYSPHIHPELEQKSLLAYLFKAYIFPGKRVRFDGQPVETFPRVPDENWIPGMDAAPDGASMGAIS